MAQGRRKHLPHTEENAITRGTRRWARRDADRIRMDVRDDVYFEKARHPRPVRHVDEHATSYERAVAGLKAVAEHTAHLSEAQLDKLARAHDEVRSHFKKKPR